MRVSALHGPWQRIAYSSVHLLAQRDRSTRGSAPAKVHRGSRGQPSSPASSRWNGFGWPERVRNVLVHTLPPQPAFRCTEADLRELPSTPRLTSQARYLQRQHS